MANAVAGMSSIRTSQQRITDENGDMVTRALHDIDSEELKQLALTALREGRNEEGIVTLKRAIELAPNDASLHYLLDTLHERIGFVERTVAAIEHSLTLNPDLDGARFQLGWIYLAHGQIDAAATVWQGHDRLGEQHPLYLFKTGLLHLAKDELDKAEETLRRGISANTVDMNLSREMTQIVNEICHRRAAAAAAHELSTNR